MSELKARTQKPLMILKKVEDRKRAHMLVDRLGDIKTLMELEQTLQEFGI